MSVPLKLSVLYVSVIRETEGCFERRLVNDLGAYWLSRKEPDVVEGTQRLKPELERKKKYLSDVVIKHKVTLGLRIHATLVGFSFGLTEYSSHSCAWHISAKIISIFLLMFRSCRKGWQKSQYPSLRLCISLGVDR